MSLEKSHCLGSDDTGAAPRKIDRDEIEQLYDRHGRVLLAYASSFFTDRSAAEDTLHQVFLKLLKGGVRITGEPIGYLCRAIRNTALNRRRHQSYEVELEPHCWLESPAGMQDIAIAIQSALLMLPEEQREIVVLHVWGHMTFEEAAAALQISANTAASRYRYGLAKLRETLKPLGKE